MINIYNISLLNLLPPSLKQDEEIRYLAQAIDTELQEISTAINQCMMIPDIDNQPEEVLNHLAKQFHVDFYDVTLPIETRRALVKNSLKWHRIKGTTAAVEDLIVTAFEDGKVVEWFEYGGQPYYFKVVTSNKAITQEQTDQFVKALNTIKRTSSVLELIELNQVEEMNLYFAGVLHIGEKLEIWQVV